MKMPAVTKIATNGIHQKETGVASYGEISDFLIDFIKKDKASTNAIIDAYAKHVNKPYAEISNNVSNALNRLKNKRIGNQVDARGRRYGSVWYFIK